MGRYPTDDATRLPRTRWTFGQVLDWHLVRGTRPGGSIDRCGRCWSRTEFADRAGLGARTVRNWLANAHLPPETDMIERALFGDGATYSDWRLELRRAHAMSWAAKSVKTARPERSGGEIGKTTTPSLGLRQEVARGPRETAAHSAIDRRHALPATNVPIRVPTHFSGREHELGCIDDAFAKTPARTAIVALVGRHGIGKTTLAAAYADRHRSRFRATWWIRAHSESLMRADMVAFGARLGWSHRDQREDAALAAVMERLGCESFPVLLVYEQALDADRLGSYLPGGAAARVLVTSDHHGFHGVAKPLAIEPWSEETGADYLLACSGRRDEGDDARALSRTLGGVPLAHEQAVSCCDRLEISLSEYRRRFERQPHP